MLVAMLLVSLCSVTAFAALLFTGALRVRRYSQSHIDGHLAVAGRGLFFSRTPDGGWWRVRLRRRRARSYEDRSAWGRATTRRRGA